MAATGAYGQRLAETLRVEHAPTIVTRVLRTADMAVTETRWDDPVPGLSGSHQREDAFLVTLALRDYPNRVYWEDGRLLSVCNVRAGQTCIHDLKRDPVALLDKPHHVLFFYLPRGALNAIADDADAPQIGDLRHDAVSFDDATVGSLGGAMLPALGYRTGPSGRRCLAAASRSSSGFRLALATEFGPSPHDTLSGYYDLG
jgi:AraC family transcriptional regulator